MTPDSKLLVWVMKAVGSLFEGTLLVKGVVFISRIVVGLYRTQFPPVHTAQIISFACPLPRLACTMAINQWEHWSLSTLPTVFGGISQDKRVNECLFARNCLFTCNLRFTASLLLLYSLLHCSIEWEKWKTHKVKNSVLLQSGLPPPPANERMQFVIRLANKSIKQYS